MNERDKLVTEAALDAILDAPFNIKLVLIGLLVGTSIFPKWRIWAKYKEGEKK